MEARSYDIEKHIFDELTKLRANGLVDPFDRLHRHELLLKIANLTGKGSTDLDRLLSLLDQALKPLGRVFDPTLRILLGLTEEARGLGIMERRDLAYWTFSGLIAEVRPPRRQAFLTFKRHREKEMLEALAHQLFLLFQRVETERQLRDPKLARTPQLGHTEAATERRSGVQR